MKFRTKIFVAFISIAIISTFFGMVIEGIETRKFIFKELQSKVKSIAASAAAEIDPSQIAQIKTIADEKLPAYNQIREHLRKIRNANRRDDIYVKYIYTIWPDPNDPQKFKFGVDAEESEKDISHAGTDDPGATSDRLYDHETQIYSYGKMEEDPWGVWLTGYAPILDANGDYVASVGVDISADLVYAELNRLLVFSLIGFIVSALLAVIMANILAQRISNELTAIITATKEIIKGNFSHRTDIKTHDEFAELAHAMNQMSEWLEEKERLKSTFTHYVSQHILQKVMKDKGIPQLGGERKKVTVLFSDIRNLAVLAETMPPERVVPLLNEYLKSMVDTILKYNGALDKFIGDGVVAEFGSPIEDPRQEENAVLAAIEMQKSLVQFSEKWKLEEKTKLELGIGIHTGEAVIGTVGIEQATEFTVIGDSFVVASRLEAATKETNYNIIISESTLKGLAGKFDTKPLGALTVPGKELPVNAFAILGKASEGANKVPL
jgi:adenylate cyclase